MNSLQSELYNKLKVLKESTHIKIFNTTKSFYLFDAKLFNVYECDNEFKKLYKTNSIHELKAITLETNKVKIGQLINHVNDLLKFNSSFNPLKESKKVTQTHGITLNPLSECNLSCKYCFAEKNISGQSTDVSFLINAIDKLVLDYGKDLKEHVIDYQFISEPFLDLKTMEKLINHVNTLEDQTGKKIRFHFNTNGTIINKRVIDLLKTVRGTNGFVHLSLDGPEEIHDSMRQTKNGKGTYLQVMKTINILKNEGFKIAVSSVLTNKFPYPKLVFEHLLSLGVDMVLIKPIRSGNKYSFDEENLSILIEGYAEYLEFFKENLSCFNEKVIRMLLGDFGLKFLNRVMLGNRQINRCPWGNHHIVMDNEGVFYPCDSFIGTKEHIIGDIDSGILSNKVNRDISTLNRSNCKSCWASLICGGTCYWDAYRTKGDILEVYEPECALNKYLIEESIKIFINDLEVYGNDGPLSKIFNKDRNSANLNNKEKK